MGALARKGPRALGMDGTMGMTWDWRRFQEEQARRNAGLVAPAVGDRRVRADGTKWDGDVYEVAGCWWDDTVELRWIRPDGTLSPRFREGGHLILFSLWAWYNQFAPIEPDNGLNSGGEVID